MKRNCPKCDREITYSDKYKLERANKNNSECRSCINSRIKTGLPSWNKGKIFVSDDEKKKKRKTYQKQYSLTEHGKQVNKNKKLKQRYGITLEEYDIMFKNQNGKCIICNDTNDLCVDHNHTTFKIRSLICRRCNIGLGAFKDNMILLEKAIEYLKGHQ